MPRKLVIYDPLGIDEPFVEQIRQTAPSVTVSVATKESLAEELAEAEIFFGYHAPAVFRGTENLRWIQATAAGMDMMLVPELIERGLTITNASGVHAPQVAETAWALTLAVARGLSTSFRRQQEHRWEPGPYYDLDGSTAGIIGLGGIGRRYARVAAAFGMRVLAVDLNQPPKPDEVESLWTLDRIDELLEAADVVMISCPYTAETHHLIDAEKLARMKPTAILVNIARGGIVDEEALSEALLADRLAGAGIDVCETEPLPAESPLWDVPNLVITPHFAGLSTRRVQRLTQFFCKNLQRYLADEPLLNVVDQQKGYPVPVS